LCPRLVGKSGVDIPAHNPIWRSGGDVDESILLLKLFPPLQNHFLVVSQDTLSIDARSKGDSRRIRQTTRCLHPMRLGNNLTSANWVTFLPCCQGLYSNLPSSASCKRQPRGQLLCAVPAARVHNCCFRLLLRAGGPRLDWLPSISAGRATMQQKQREFAGSRAQFARRHVAECWPATWLDPGDRGSRAHPGLSEPRTPGATRAPADKSHLVCSQLSEYNRSHQAPRAPPDRDSGSRYRAPCGSAILCNFSPQPV